jgi:hypothetical protein
LGYCRRCSVRDTWIEIPDPVADLAASVDAALDAVGEPGLLMHNDGHEGRVDLETAVVFDEPKAS